ncbi:MAG: hypothetical protein HZB29_13395 [Nitrospinae bacterium]|nr:hypothetical protein [Nitrospinota bacterium]
MGTGSFGAGGIGGHSNVMQVKSLRGFANAAMKASEAFASSARRISSGASGSSRISVMA